MHSNIWLKRVSVTALMTATVLVMTACSHNPAKDAQQVQITNHQKNALANAGTANGVQQHPLRLLVLDFSTLDQKVLQYLPPPTQATSAPVPADSDMQSDQAHRNWQQLSDIERSHYNQLEHLMTSHQGHATVLGADLLANDLSQFPGWTILDRSRWLQGVHTQISAQTLAQVVANAHPDILIYGLVEDLGQRKSNFTGYGVDTVARRTYLHILVRAVSAQDFSILASGEYSAESDESQDARSQAYNSDRVRNLMSQAVQQASNDLIARLGPSAPK